MRAQSCCSTTWWSKLGLQHNLAGKRSTDTVTSWPSISWMPSHWTWPSQYSWSISHRCPTFSQEIWGWEISKSRAPLEAMWVWRGQRVGLINWNEDGPFVIGWFQYLWTIQLKTWLTGSLNYIALVLYGSVWLPNRLWMLHPLKRKRCFFELDNSMNLWEESALEGWCIFWHWIRRAPLESSPSGVKGANLVEWEIECFKIIW